MAIERDKPGCKINFVSWLTSCSLGPMTSLLQSGELEMACPYVFGAFQVDEVSKINWLMQRIEIYCSCTEICARQERPSLAVIALPGVRTIC